MNFQGFLLVIIPITLSPGASFTLAISNVAIAGIRGALPIIFGTCVGLIIHGVVAWLGVSSLVAGHPPRMNALNLFGILFLAFIGVKLLIAGYRSFMATKDVAKTPAGFKEALILNLLNGKALLVYFTIVPLFSGDQLHGYLFLSLMHSAILALWILGVCSLLVLCRSSFNFRYLGGFINLAGGAILLFITSRLAYQLYN